MPIVEPGTVNAPEFPADLDWLNTDRPLRMKELRGKIVLLDFWTYCCINCMHVLPDLERLERKYKDFLVVIGVHSAKFSGEKETDNIRQAILRYGISHPVVNDREMRVWSEYAVQAWPSFMLVDPRGKIFGMHSGERIYELFDGVIAQMAEQYEAEGLLDRAPLDFRMERESEPSSTLLFPGKVLADADSDRLFIADSGHQRIVVVSLTTGQVLDVIGGAGEGLEDGGFAEARFRNPQGMALEGDLLYIADTDNHALRRADLRSRMVVTLAGDGGQDLELNNLPGPARGRRLNSPWDLTLAHGVLFIAMAGSHQVWGYDLEGGYIAGHAGSGREDHVDGPLLAASLAQPSGLTHDGTNLFVADSEVSSIRSVDLDPRGGHVKTVVGEGLFDFGDVDGGPDVARLQHPLDVEYVEGSLFVADTYNNKIKRIGLHTRSVKTFAGAAQQGFADGPAAEARFDEPAGLSHANGRLYVADTNNHAVRVVDVSTGAVSTFAIEEPHKLALRPQDEPIALEPLRARAGRVKLTIEVELPTGAKLNPRAGSEVEIVVGGDRQVFALEGLSVEAELEIPESGATLRIEPAVYYCREGREALCYFFMRAFEARIEANPDADSAVSIRLRASETHAR